MTQGPPAPPHPIAHGMKMHGNRWTFDDSWAARAPPPKPCKCMKIFVFSMNQGPPAFPHPMVFNDSWDARAAHPTAETMQMHMNLSFSMNQGPHQPIAHTMKMHGNLHIFNDSEAARVAHITAETMHMLGSRCTVYNSGGRPGRARWFCANHLCAPSTAFTRLSVFFGIRFGRHMVPWCLAGRLCGRLCGACLR